MSSVISVRNLSVSYGDKAAIRHLSIDFEGKLVTALIGPSGCGKSTFLRTLNRMNDFIEGIKIKGSVFFYNSNIYSKKCDPVTIRKRIGMVFQKPNPFPKTIFQNIIWGPKINGFSGNEEALVRRSLKKAALWNEVKERLHESAFNLSGGQKQRLCIARTIAMDPEVILMDEPCSSLDPGATASIEELIKDLSKKYTILIVTHNMQQASRISDKTVFLFDGKIIESGDTSKIFTKPVEKKTEDYITGRFG